MFMNLEDNDMGVVIDAMDEKKVKAGDNVINEGENGNELYVVEDGQLDCFKKFVTNFSLTAHRMIPTSPSILRPMCQAKPSENLPCSIMPQERPPSQPKQMLTCGCSIETHLTT